MGGAGGQIRRRGGRVDGGCGKDRAQGRADKSTTAVIQESRLTTCAWLIVQCRRRSKGRDHHQLSEVLAADPRAVLPGRYPSTLAFLDSAACLPRQSRTCVTGMLVQEAGVLAQEAEPIEKLAL